MSRMNRRRFTWVATSGIASAALVACAPDAVRDDLDPTQIPDVEGAPPTLAPQATPFSSDTAEGGDAAAAGDTGGNGGGGGGPVEVVGIDIDYEPKELTIPPDTDVEIHFVNEGSLQHDFNIEDTEYATALLNGGEEETITVNLPEGEYVYYCSVPGHREAGMVGTLIVSADAAAAGAEDGEGEGEGDEEAAAADDGAAAGDTGPIQITCIDIDYEEKEVTIPADTDVEFHVVNEGALQHDFNIEETEFASEMLNAGEEDTLTVNLPEGEYVYFCSVPGHREAGMVGTLIVSADGGGEAAAAEEGDGEATAVAEEGGEDAAAAGGGEPVEVLAVDIAFEPTSFEVAPGQEIRVVNDGAMQHDFVVEEMDLATELLNSGEEQTITVPEDAEPGDYTYYCSVPGHREAGMEGTMTITDGGGAAASGEGEEGETAAAASDEAAAASGSDGGPITVEMFDSLQYEPAEFNAVPGQTITVINRGTLQHDFVVDEWGLATPLLNRDEEHDLIVPDSAESGQTYTFYCSVPGHQAAGMEGRLTIGEGEPAEDDGEAEAPLAPESGTDEGEDTTSVQLDPNVIHVSALDSMRFAPSQFSAAPGQQIHLVNVGVLVHDIVVDEWGLDSGPLEGGAEATFNVPEDAEVGSEHTFYCSVPGHRESGMEGTITIIEADVRQMDAVTPVAEASPAAEGATPAADATPADDAATPVADGDAEAPLAPDTGDSDATPAATPADGAAASGGGSESVEVVGIDIAFEPTELTIPADTDVEIHFINEGALQHDFNIEDTDYATEILNAGQEETITVNLAAGEYVYFCSVPGHRQAGMEGTLTVE